MTHFKITIIKARRPASDDLNDDLQWFCRSLGFFTMRDKDRSMFRIFIELLKSTRQRNPLTSDQIAFKTQLSRGTVVHHINKLMEAGLVVNEKKAYLLRVDNLEVLIDELERDIKLAMDDMRRTAHRIDRDLGI